MVIIVIYLSMVKKNYKFKAKDSEIVPYQLCLGDLFDEMIFDEII